MNAGQLQFGYSVSMSGNYIVVGAVPSDSTVPGNAYLFQANAYGGFSQVVLITANVSSAGDGFGTSVSITGSNIFIGACNVNGNSVGNLYTFTTDGTQVSQSQQFIGANINFGTTVVASDQLLLVGATSNSGSGSSPSSTGVVYYYSSVVNPPASVADKTVINIQILIIALLSLIALVNY